MKKLNHRVAIHDSYRPVTAGDVNRPEIADLFEMERGMPGIIKPEQILPPRPVADVCGELPITVPK